MTPSAGSLVLRAAAAAACGVAALLFAAAASGQGADRRVCDQLLGIEAEMNKFFPSILDEETEALLLRVNCGNRTVTLSKRLLLATAALPAGWAERRQRQHRELNCAAGGLGRAGWTAVDVIYGTDLEYVTTFFTWPPDCR